MICNLVLVLNFCDVKIVYSTRYQSNRQQSTDSSVFISPGKYFHIFLSPNTIQPAGDDFFYV